MTRQRLTRQKLTHFSSFDHYENASIFGEGLYDDSEIEWWILRPTQNRLLFKFRVVLCRIRLFPTLILKIKWLGSELPLNIKWGASSRWTSSQTKLPSGRRAPLYIKVPNSPTRFAHKLAWSKKVIPDWWIPIGNFKSFWNALDFSPESVPVLPNYALKQSPYRPKTFKSTQDQSRRYCLGQV